MTKKKDNILLYSLAGLLYVPANNISIVKHIKENDYNKLTSIVFCLEDSIMDDVLEEAEQILFGTLLEIEKLKSENCKLPYIFIRVRTPEHLKAIYSKFNKVLHVITGFVLPKIDDINVKKYVGIIKAINKNRANPLYFMPIIESARCIEKGTRLKSLLAIHKKISPIKQYILNIRVGGNDFSNIYGLRRHVNQSIYEIKVVADALIDILNVFSKDYVVSGPVWEYFDNNTNSKWKEGLEKELEKDILNGFIGKTCIHPSQLPVVYNGLKVSKEDFNDAKALLNWENEQNAVARVKDNNRMNEVKCHERWARKIITLSEIYGFREEND